MILKTTYLLPFILPIFMFGQQSNVSDISTKELWEGIELTSRKAKLLPVTQEKSHIWIPVAAGTAALTTTLILIGNNDKGSDLIVPPVAKEDNYLLMCGMSARFTPLDNDTGEELFISRISDVPLGVILVNTSTIEVAGSVTNSFIFNYTVTDKNGNTASATISVSIEYPTLMVSDQNLEVISGQIITGNILTGSDCPECRITQVSGNTDNSMEWNENGSFTLKIENLTSSATLHTFIFHITGKCSVTSTARITVNVLPKLCDVEPSVIITPSNCGMDDGSISINNIEDSYDFTWNTGSNHPFLTGIDAGIYTLTITNSELSCIKTFSFSLEEKIAEYIQDIQISPGNCYQSGKVLMQIKGLSLGPFMINVSGAAGIFSFEIAEGKYDIADLISKVSGNKIITGQYEISVRDVSKEIRCTQTITINIPEEDVKLQLLDDIYTTGQSLTVTGNILDNDIGVGLEVTDIEFPPEVMMEWKPDGSFKFKGISGQYEFIYTATDTCGQKSTAKIIIKIEDIVCDYQVTFTVTPALCGAANGNAVALITPADQSELIWSNGVTGPSLLNVMAGMYSLTVTHPTGACQQSFSVNIPQTEIPYVNEYTVIQQNCHYSAEVILNLTAPISGFLTIIAVGPNSTETFNVPEGYLLLSNFITLTPGIWTLVINDTSIPPECSQNITFEINIYAAPVLTLLDIEPPSSTTAKDGIVFVNITGGTPPYTISGPGQTYNNLIEGFNALPGFPSGVFTLFAVDAEGCITPPIIVEMFGGKPSLKTQIYVSPKVHFLLRNKMDYEKPPTDEVEILPIQLDLVNVSFELEGYFIGLACGKMLSFQDISISQSMITDLKVFMAEGGRKWTHNNFTLQGSVQTLIYKWRNKNHKHTASPAHMDLNFNIHAFYKINDYINIGSNITWHPNLKSWYGGQTVRFYF